MIDVPFLSSVFLILSSTTVFPFSNWACFISPSLKDSIWNFVDKAFTALSPTPFNPTDFWKASESYFPPVLIFETQSIRIIRENQIPLFENEEAIKYISNKDEFWEYINSNLILKERKKLSEESKKLINVPQSVVATREQD